MHALRLLNTLLKIGFKCVFPAFLLQSNGFLLPEEHLTNWLQRTEPEAWSAPEHQS